MVNSVFDAKASVDLKSRRPDMRAPVRLSRGQPTPLRRLLGRAGLDQRSKCQLARTLAIQTAELFPRKTSGRPSTLPRKRAKMLFRVREGSLSTQYTSNGLRQA